MTYIGDIVTRAIGYPVFCPLFLGVNVVEVGRATDTLFAKTCPYSPKNHVHKFQAFFIKVQIYSIKIPNSPQYLLKIQYPKQILHNLYNQQNLKLSSPTPCMEFVTIIMSISDWQDRFVSLASSINSHWHTEPIYCSWVHIPQGEITGLLVSHVIHGSLEVKI